MITTTTIGAYPKPAYVPVTDWFTMAGRDSELTDYTSAYAAELEAAGADAEARFARATAEVIDDQIAAGIHVVTDGEVRRENYVHHQCRHFAGFDFYGLSRHRLRGTIDSLLPTIRADVAFSGSPLTPSSLGASISSSTGAVSPSSASPSGSSAAAASSLSTAPASVNGRAIVSVPMSAESGRRSVAAAPSPAAPGGRSPMSKGVPPALRWLSTRRATNRREGSSRAVKRRAAPAG